MTIYEIDKEIMNCIDPETGEIDEEKMSALQMERDKKIENAVFLYKQRLAEAKAIKEEKMNLAARQKAAENSAESIKKYIADALDGQTFKTARADVRYRKSEGLVIEDESRIPEDFINTVETIDKAELKRSIKNGLVVDGVYLEERQNIQIR